MGDYKYDIEEYYPGYVGRNKFPELKGIAPWADAQKSENRSHYKLTDKERKKISICLNCTKTKCTGNCKKMK